MDAGDRFRVPVFLHQKDRIYRVLVVAYGVSYFDDVESGPFVIAQTDYGQVFSWPCDRIDA